MVIKCYLWYYLQNQITMREYAKKPERQSRTLDSNPRASRQASIDVIVQRYKERNIKRYAEDEELVQGKFGTIQHKEIDENELLQGKFESNPITEQESIQQEEKSNKTGLPDNLKTGIENLSGYSMDDVNDVLQYKKAKPIQLLTVNINEETYKILDAVPNTQYFIVRRNWHPFSIRYLYKAGTNRLIRTIPMSANQTRRLINIMQNLGNIHVANITNLIDSLTDGPVQPIELILTRLDSINSSIQNMVLPRIQNDHEVIVAMLNNSIPNIYQQAFNSFEIPGSDPHKGGQVVVFINYNRIGGGVVKIVYKPGNLHVDQFLYARNNSIAHKMAGNAPMPTYNIVPEVDTNAPDERSRHYGYMEYVQTEGPQTANEVLSVYNSLGKNLAIAYVFGLRDIHYENFILRRDSILFIDMEAATGTFTGFNTLDFAFLPDRLAQKIRANLSQQQLTAINNWLPHTNDLIQMVKNGFEQGLRSISQIPNLNNDIAFYSGLRTRFVPFPTSDLQNICQIYHGRLGVQNPQYNNTINDLAHNTANGNQQLELGFLQLLNHQDTITALNRGDIPFWTRSGNNVYGESGVLILQNFNHPRLEDNLLINQNVTGRVMNAMVQIRGIGQLRNVLIPMLGDPHRAIIGN